MLKLRVFGILMLMSVLLMAQNGTIKGTVSEKSNGEPVPFANVVAVGTTMGASTDFDGNFTLSIPPGTYSVEFTFIGYNKVIKEAVVVTKGQTVVLNQSMEVSSAQLAEVEIVSKKDRESQSILTFERKEATTLKENIGSKDMIKKGVSNVEDGLTRVTGVSKVSSRGVYVRGLGDRYNNVYLNGFPLPSPNPNRKVIDLDIFPTSIVRNIDVYKTFNVQQFGDMSGASLNIFTKDVPTEGFMTVSIGANYNSGTTLKNFRTNNDGNLNYFGFDGGGRANPEVGGDGVASFKQTTNDPFSTNFGYEEIDAPLDANYSLQGGKSWNVGDQGRVGFITSVSHRNSNRYDEGSNNILDAAQTPTSDFQRQRWQYSANTTALATVNYTLDKKNSINLNYLLINNADNNYILSEGIVDELDNPEQFKLIKQRSRYEQKTLNDFQLSGRHDLKENLTVKWGGSYALANTEEPDRRDLAFLASQGVSDRGSLNAGTGGVLQRYFQTTKENEYFGFAEAVIKLGKSESLDVKGGESTQKLVIGAQYKGKKRDVNSIIYNLEFSSSSPFINEQLKLDDLNSVFTDAAYNAGEYGYSINQDNSNNSVAERSIAAGYAYLDYDLTSQLKVVPGIRMEYSPQSITYYKLGAVDPEIVETSVLDWLPSLAVKYTLDEKNIVRFSASKTLTRPNFQELILVPFVNENQQSIVGNAFLENSASYNADLKFENYTLRGDLFSIGGFYKYIDMPIEQVRSGVNFISYFNMNYAHVAGIEFDFTRRLSSLVKDSEKSLVRHLYFDGNLTLMYSQVNTSDLDERTQSLLQNITEDNRQLQGASPYLVNFSVGFDKPWGKKTKSSNISLSYNHFGDRIYSVGTQDRGDEYELGFGSLNIVAQHEWKNGFALKLAIQNLLNPAIERQQKAGDKATVGDVVTQSYKTGFNVGITATYDLF